jgi:hypothetical protein
MMSVDSSSSLENRSVQTDYSASCFQPGFVLSEQIDTGYVTQSSIVFIFFVCFRAVFFYMSHAPDNLRVEVKQAM